MTRVKTRPAVLLGSPDEVEQQFYEALREGDLDRLMAVWSEDEEVVCIHPGGQRLMGLAAVRAGFEAMLSEGTLNLQYEPVSCSEGLSYALHSVTERVELVTEEGVRIAWMHASNVYIKTALGWRMLAHHASPGHTGEPLASMEASGLLH